MPCTLPSHTCQGTLQVQGASDLFGGSGPLAKHAEQCILSQIFLRPMHESQAFPGTGSGVSCQDSWCWPRGPQLGPTCEVCALRPPSNSEDLRMSSGCSGKPYPSVVPALLGGLGASRGSPSQAGNVTRVTVIPGSWRLEAAVASGCFCSTEAFACLVRRDCRHFALVRGETLNS